MTPPTDAAPRGLDERQLRFERGVASVLLLSGFVWKRDLVMALVAVAVTASMVSSWNIRPFGVLFESLIKPRLRPVHTHLSMTAVRTDDLVVSIALFAASMFVFVGLPGFAQLLSLLIAGALMIEAAGGMWLSAPLWQRLRSRR